MTAAGAPGLVSPPPARGAPLLVTAVLPPDVLAWADGQRRAHYPPERNRLEAHVTLFHAIPASARAEVERRLTRMAGATAPVPASFSGVMDLGRGTALALASPALVALHAELAEALAGVIQPRDDRPFRPHVTLQNAADLAAARALQTRLAGTATPGPFRLRGFGLHGWDGALWRFERALPFRGRG